MLMEKIKNNLPLLLDLKNGILLDLIYNDDIKAYKGYWKEENIYIGIWEKETLIKILTGEYDNVKIS